MALDHTRDYLHYPAYLFDPTDPNHSTLPIFLTRFVTHFCAPAFCFLAGISAFMVGKRKTLNELSAFLVKRGIWLIFIELTIVNFGWYFDASFNNPGLLVIWSLGISMIVLAALVHLPKSIILLFSCIVIFGHNLLDSIHFQGSIFWAILHEVQIFDLPDGRHLDVFYPVIPWIAVMSLGYYFGTFYDSSFDNLKRKKWFNIIGSAAIALFIILRMVNHYGDPIAWQYFDSVSKNIITFFNPSKYPPSLLYLLMTLGFVFLFLANSEKLKGKIVDFFSTFGRVPFFYYILHIYLIHIVAMLLAEFSGFGWRVMILRKWVNEAPELKGFGFPLWVVYTAWVGVILFLYPICKKFDRYKHSHKEKWWLSYL